MKNAPDNLARNQQLTKNAQDNQSQEASPTKNAPDKSRMKSAVQDGVMSADRGTAPKERKEQLCAVWRAIPILQDDFF